MLGRLLIAWIGYGSLALGSFAWWSHIQSPATQIEIHCLRWADFSVVDRQAALGNGSAIACSLALDRTRLLEGPNPAVASRLLSTAYMSWKLNGQHRALAIDLARAQPDFSVWASIVAAETRMDPTSVRDSRLLIDCPDLTDLQRALIQAAQPSEVVAHCWVEWDLKPRRVA